MIVLLCIGLATAAPEKDSIQPDLADPKVRLETQLDVLDVMIDSGLAGQAMDMVRDIRERGVDDVRLDVVQARAMSATGLQAEARSLLESARKKKPRSPEVLAALGVVYADEGETHDALSVLERATRYAPKDAEIRNNYGWVLLAGGKAEAAVRELQTSLRLDPGNARTRNNLGFALARLKRDSEALEAFRGAALAENRGEADARFNLGVACEQRGERDTAIIQYQSALNLQNDHSLAKAALQRLLHPESS